MKNLLLPACLSLVLTTSLSPSHAKTPPEPRPSLAINLTGPDDWNTEIPFVDAFKLSRRWISQMKGASWGQGPQLQLDEFGYVKKLEPGCFAETLILSVSGRLPEGTYTLLYDGEGTIQVKGSDGAAVQIADSSPGRISFHVTPSPTKNDSPISVSITEVNPENYIRNIRVLLPGHEETYAQQPFRPGFLEMWKNMSAYRFMDWMKTNNSRITNWSQRPRPEFATWTGQGGVPLEIMIELANRQKVAPWFCMPHQADDDYIRNFASLVKDKLDPSLKIYIEYSNEVWNSMFQQHKWCSDKGLELNLATKPWEAAWRFYAKRSVEIFKIWEDVFGGSNRLIRVLASQSSTPHVARQILSFEQAGNHADALAIAPYIHFNVPPKSDNPNTPLADDVATWDVQRLMQEMTENKLPEALEQIRAHKEIADQYGLALIAYEGGQHAVGIQGAQDNPQLTQLFMDANRSEAMGQLYEKYLQGWQEAGGGLLAHFASIGRWSKWGCWGIMEYFNSQPSDYPKYQKLKAWAASLGQNVSQ